MPSKITSLLLVNNLRFYLKKYKLCWFDDITIYKKVPKIVAE